jgi:hypothetical protein
MRPERYQEIAMNKLNTPMDSKDLLIHSIMGLSIESGKAIDFLKENMIYNKELNEEDLVIALGNIVSYIATAATALDIPLGEILRRNIRTHI